jgi:hypothetical protein
MATLPVVSIALSGRPHYLISAVDFVGLLQAQGMSDQQLAQEIQEAASSLSRVMLEFSGGQSELHEAALQEEIGILVNVQLNRQAAASSRSAPFPASAVLGRVRATVWVDSTNSELGQKFGMRICRDMETDMITSCASEYVLSLMSRDAGEHLSGRIQLRQLASSCSRDPSLPHLLLKRSWQRHHDNPVPQSCVLIPVRCEQVSSLVRGHVIIGKHTPR